MKGIIALIVVCICVCTVQGCTSGQGRRPTPVESPMTLAQESIIARHTIKVESVDEKVVIVAGGSRITVDPVGTVTIEALNIEIKAAGNLKLSGMNVDISATAKASIRSGGTVDVDGTPITLN